MPFSPAATPPLPSRRFRSLLTLGSVMALAACAQLPDLAERQPLASPADFQSAQALNAPQSDWPVERWWAGYGDAQLAALVDEALRGSPDMAVATARLRLADAATQTAASALRPQLSANASITEEKLSYNYLFPRSQKTDGWNDYGRATLDFSWELDFWGRHRAALAAATSERQASQAEWAQARLLLSSGIASAYAELSRLFASRDTALQSIEVRRKTATLLAERFDNGMENRASVRQADARRTAAEGALLQLDEQIGLQRHRIAVLIGAGPDRGLSIERPRVKLEQSFGLPAQLALDLLGRRPDVIASRLQAQAQASRIEQKSAEFYPNVNLSAFVGVQSLGLDLLGKNGSDIGSVGPAISLPLLNGGRLRGELRASEARYEEAVARYQGTLARALQEVADSALSQKALAAQLDKSRETVAAATEAYRIARQRYEGGLANYLDVLSAEDLLLGSLDALTELQARSFTLDIALKRALGGGYQVAQR
ncbi:MAG: efflux transporter outer membrane subunit [Burkholderiales bacterium]|nr:efflux transporter outer membrane subunit [Burkholderiales bacterium]